MSDQRVEDDRRLARYIERHQLVSAMNDTKWREAVASLRRILGDHIEFRVRCVRDPLDTLPPRDRSFPWHLPPDKHIEWLDWKRSPRSAAFRSQRHEPHRMKTVNLSGFLRGIREPRFSVIASTLDCGNGCVDVVSSPAHCGACTTTCAAAQDCVGSTCVCKSGLTNCQGVCVDLQIDGTNCGLCGHACVGKKTCLGGACQ